eukprot:1606117-Lingulodinium_polyedra.AAC.1
MAHIAGAKKQQSSTAVLMVQKDPKLDPIYAATLPLVKAYASRVWCRAVDFSLLRRAWEAVERSHRQ